MKHICLFLVALTNYAWINAQSVALNPGVDTTNTEAKAVVTCWINYLQSKPNKENSKNSAYWAETEKTLYPKADQLLNAINSETPTYAMGNATILYVKPVNDFYEIKTLFGWTDTSQHFFALCITSVFAKKENGNYVLYNSLTVESQHWQSHTRGSVTFHCPPGYVFDEKKSTELLSSIDALQKEWKLKPIPIHYYFANTYEEVQHLRGLDYSLTMGNADKPSGMADTENNIVFAGGLGENYFHEVVHIYLNRLFPSSPLVEGLAVFYGGTMGHTLQWHLVRMDEYLNKHPEIDLNNFENFWYMDNFTNPNSVIQGLICYTAYKKGGLDGLKKLMSYDNVYTAIEKELGVKKNELNNYLRNQIQQNKN